MSKTSDDTITLKDGRFPITLEDDSQILFDATSQTTRWVIWKSNKTDNDLHVAIVQKENKVSVSVKNLRHLLEQIIPGFEESTPSGPESN
jgi:hypothetical protein